ncbi:MAG: hypothetical protein WB760_11305 [Xanthobacteraceae bacterium]
MYKHAAYRRRIGDEPETEDDQFRLEYLAASGFYPPAPYAFVTRVKNAILQFSEGAKYNCAQLANQLNKRQFLDAKGQRWSRGSVSVFVEKFLNSRHVLPPSRRT